MRENQFNICIVGAGVIGLAIAYKLSKYYNDIIVLDKESTFGQHISSRNSEVIHSGYYYPPNSLKSALCVNGNNLLYEFSNKYLIKHKNCGKLVAIDNLKDESKLIKIFNSAIKNNVECKILNKDESKNIESRIKTEKSLWLPSAGIIDSHGLMSKLEFLSKRNNVSFLYNHLVKSISKYKNGYQLLLNDNYEKINSKIVINAGGLWAHKIAQMVGIDYEVDYYKGDYYKCRSIRDLNCLIYPLPKIKSLGVHSVLSLNGEVSFGPNIYKINDVDYTIDDQFKQKFLNQINKYIDIKSDNIYPDFSGIRPKIKFNNNFNDFIISNEKQKGLNKFINLIGIDSPGLTSSLAIADYVSKIIKNEKLLIK